MADHPNKKELLEQSQNTREDAVASFADNKDLAVAASNINGSIESYLIEDQLRFLNIKTSHTLSNKNVSDKSQDKSDNSASEDSDQVEVEEIGEDFDISAEQLMELQDEFEQLLKEMSSLLAEIGGLLSELGSPPDKQKLALLKDKLNQLQSLRSRMRRLGFKLPLKYRKMFKVEKYFEQIHNFITQNEGQLRQLAKDAKLNPNSDMFLILELSLQRDKIFEDLSEKLSRLQSELQSEKDPRKREILQKEIVLVREKLQDLECQIGLKKDSAIAKESTTENAKAVEIELIMEEAAAAMFAELNGLIQGQSFGHATFLEAHSINMHKTMTEIIDDFSVGALAIENVDNFGLIHAEHKKHPQANIVEAQSINQSRHLISTNDTLVNTAPNPQSERDNIVEQAPKPPSFG